MMFKRNCGSINFYAAMKYETFTEVKHHELGNLVAILLAMGLNRQSEIKAYWSKNDIYFTQ